jgi:hypothetical protein
MERRGRRSKQLLGKENGGHWKLKEDALVSTACRTRFERGYGEVIFYPLFLAPPQIKQSTDLFEDFGLILLKRAVLTHCERVTQISVFNTVKLGTSASSP